MIIDCIPDRMKLTVFLELQSWLIHLDIANMAKPDREKITGIPDAPRESKVSQIQSSD